MFDYRSAIRMLLSKHESKDIFDELIMKIEIDFSSASSSLQQMTKKSTKYKGTVWEQFCKDWLLAKHKIRSEVKEYEEVYLLSEVPDQILSELQLKRQDAGIDLIGIVRKDDKIEYVAIQCKYRNPKQKNLLWKDLSTFLSLAERTGPYRNTLVMSNCVKMSRKGIKRLVSEKSHLYQTFANTKRDHWERICQVYCPRTLSDGILQKMDSILDDNMKEVNDRFEKMRLARISYFAKYQV